jgi:hypothetical protein
MNSVHYVGMDVDKEKIVLARLGAGRTAEVQEHVIANTPSAVKKYFTAFSAPTVGCDEPTASRP